MASTEGPARAHDRHGRRRPFANWMKRLANLKSLHSDSNSSVSSRRTNVLSPHRKGSISKNNPYPLSSRIEPHVNQLSLNTPLSGQKSRQSSLVQSKLSVSNSDAYIRSRPATLATTAETTMSDAAPSGAGTSGTAARTEGDRNSTFSSPAPSVRSLTTTLTTIQSSAPAQNILPGTNQAQNITSAPSPTPYGAHIPASAVPAHLAPHAHPTTYYSATANNVLTDDASILTLASSSKRRRRNSVDTNASMKALAPNSIFGGSRESLPLSVLSSTIIHPTQAADTVSLRDSVGVASNYPRSTLNAERASLISVSGITAPALASERNSYMGGKYGGDAASVRSGLLGTTSAGGPTGMHVRNDSITGSIGGRENREYRDREREKQPDKERDGMVTAPTSPLLEETISNEDNHTDHQNHSHIMIRQVSHIEKQFQNL